MFGFSLLLLIETSKSKLWLTLCMQTRPSWEQRSALLAFLSPCFAFLSCPRVSHTGSAFQKSSLAVLPSPFTEMQAAKPFTAVDAGFIPTYSFHSPPSAAPSTHSIIFSCSHQTWTSSLLHSQHCSALSLMHAQVMLTCALHFKILPNSSITHREAFG